MTSDSSPDRAVSRQHDLQRGHRADEEVRVPSLIAAPDSIDAWRHRRMYEPLAALVGPNQSWLTVGDSGADAHWLRSQGASKIVASSLSARNLLALRDLGHLEGVEIAEFNAEAIDRPDASFDFVLCKEAFHHFARPMVGFYELLRVSRRAVIFLAEPTKDERARILDSAKAAIKTVLRKGTEQANNLFETSGNFIYGLSLHEASKAATALQYRDLYYLHLNDFYLAGLSHRPWSDHGARLLTRTGVAAQNFAARLGLLEWGNRTIVLFKTPPSPDLARRLTLAGMRKREIPFNPYS